MTDQADPILKYLEKENTEGKWGKAKEDIFYFIEQYVPKDLFDLSLASDQQKTLLRKVQEGEKFYVIRACRKGGKTIIVAIVAVWLTLRNQSYRVFIVAGSETQAAWLYSYCKDILWPSGPENREQREFFSQFLEREPMTKRTQYKAGGFIMYTAASEKQVNAPTADCLILDEFVLIPENIIEEAWPMITASDNPMRFILSTATAGKENTDAFLDILDDAEPDGPLGKAGWTKVVWERKDAKHLQTEASQLDAESAKYFLSDDMYRTQYQGKIPRRAGRVFPRTFIRKAFVKPDPENPGFLMDGTPYDPEALVFQGEAAGGIDWGFEHDTVLTEGYRALGGKIVLMQLIIESGTSPSKWGDLIEEHSVDYGITTWYADAAGAFQNAELRDRGLRVIPRAFQNRRRGKEWMIGICYKWFAMDKFVIPDTPEFQPLKKQLLSWKRGTDGKPKKGGYDACDSFICFGSAFDPRYYTESSEEMKTVSTPISPRAHANDWRSFRSGKKTWQPPGWEEKDELEKEIWE